MATIKRKALNTDIGRSKKVKVYGQKKVATIGKGHAPQAQESDASVISDEDSFEGFAGGTSETSDTDAQAGVGPDGPSSPTLGTRSNLHEHIATKGTSLHNSLAPAQVDELFIAVGSTSKESHAKQKALVQERKASKPNADSIARSKKIWERLRIKSAVPREERKALVEELFGIITGKVKDFVFKHDSVRVVQTAIKYANQEQRHVIARELKGDYKTLAESKYAKFLIGKLVVHGDKEIRDLIIPEFYGHVKKLVRNPEASWIVDDIYRAVATPEQKARLLREWYGPEFVIFQAPEDEKPTADLSEILLRNPEKRGPIMQHLHELINQLVQKKTTGFTMLHDAMLQYFLNTKSDSPEVAEFIEKVKDDETGDCLKNLAFTKSGSRLVCLILAHAGAKDRKQILRFYKDTVKMLAADPHGHSVILTAFDVIDDTVMTSKAIFPELLGKDLSEGTRQQELLEQLNHLTARIPLLYLFSAVNPRWLLPDVDTALLQEVQIIRSTTSKKDPAARRKELVKGISSTLLELITADAESLAATNFGCQAITEVLLGADGDKKAALDAVAHLARTKPEAMNSPGAGRMLKTLVLGGRFNAQSKAVESVDPALGFHNVLYEQIKSDIKSWAISPNSFVVVGLTEADGFGARDALLEELGEHEKELQHAADGDKKGAKPNKGAALLLEKLKLSS